MDLVCDEKTRILPLDLEQLSTFYGRGRTSVNGSELENQYVVLVLEERVLGASTGEI